MKKNLQLLCAFAFAITTCTAQETTEPVKKGSNRIILHYDDTTGLFTQLVKIFMDKGYDIEWKDREFGIVRTGPKYLFEYTQTFSVIKALLKDSTIIMYGFGRQYDFYNEARSSRNKEENKGSIATRTWNEMMKIAELMKPKSITYSHVE
jgi:hypothetical protein